MSDLREVNEMGNPNETLAALAEMADKYHQRMVYPTGHRYTLTLPTWMVQRLRDQCERDQITLNQYLDNFFRVPVDVYELGDYENGTPPLLIGQAH